MKTRFFSMRLTFAELEALKRSAVRENLTPSSFLRAIIHQTAIDHCLSKRLIDRMSAEVREYGFRRRRRGRATERAEG